MIATCNLCKKFSVPAPLDPIGAELMKAHLADCQRAKK